MFIDLGFERWQVLGLGELCWGKGHPGLYKALAKEERRTVMSKSSEREREIRSSLLILDLRGGKF